MSNPGILAEGDHTHVIDEDHMSLPELRAEMEGHGAAWSAILARDLDPHAILVGSHDDGSETHAATSVRIAQVLHHGTDHRSQICTALTALGIEPPAIDVWAYGERSDHLVEVPPTS